MSKIDQQRERIAAMTGNKTILRGDETPESQEMFRKLAQLRGASPAPLTVNDDGVVDLRGIKITPVGAEIPNSISTNDFMWAVGIIVQLEGALQWVIGDMIAFGMAQYGELGTWAEAFNRDKGTLSNWASACRALPKTSRWREVSFSHHLVVLHHPQRDEMLKLAATNRWSVAKLREYAFPKQITRGGWWTDFENRVFKAAHKGDKHEIAERLRRLADQIDAGETV